MKRLLKYLLIFGALIMGPGCSEDFLTTVPTDQLSSGTFWTSERDFNVALNAGYERMVGQDLNTMYFDAATEIGYSHADWMRQHEYVMGRADALSGWSNSLWGRMFAGVTRANEILAQLDGVAEGVLTATGADQIRGQALFLRGYYYQELLWMFGGVPIFTSVPTVQEAREAGRNTREEVYAQIEADLTAAAALLPPTFPSSQFGRAGRGTALAYHARAALYEASWQEYREGNSGRATELYRTAANKSKAVMDLNVFTLHPNYRELFTYAGEMSNEIILSYQKVSGQNGWWAWLGFAPSSMGSNVDAEPTRELVNLYPMKDGLPIDESPLYDPAPPKITYDATGAPTVETLGMYADRDPRFYGTVLFPGGAFNGTIYNSYPPCAGGAPAGYCSPTSDRILINDYYNTYTGYILMKYVDPQDQAAPGNSGLNVIKMRYGDVLLMYAEAKAELGEVDGTVQAALKQLRDRVDIPMPFDITTVSAAEAIKYIRTERTIELAWEGLHLADIRRWGVAEQVLNGPVHGIDVATGDGTFAVIPGQHVRVFAAPRDYLWPVPAAERDLNVSLVQNPGY